MEKIRVICPNCGSEVEADKFSVAVFCESCGGKIIIKKDKNDESSEYEKKKALLRKAYETRDISDITVRAKDVMEIYPNDFFANFLYAYCLLRRGNNNGMLNFFANAEVDAASEDEIEIVLSEITRSRNYFEKKKALIERIEASGFNTAKYSDYLNPVETAQKPNENVNSELYVKACKKLNRVSAIWYGFSVIFVLILIGIISGNTTMTSFEILVAEIAITAVITILSPKFGYNGVFLLVSLIISFGVYLVIRAIVAYSVYSMCLRKQGKGITYKSLFMHGKL